MPEPETESGIRVHPDGSTSTEPAALPVEEQPVLLAAFSPCR